MISFRNTPWPVSVGVAAAVALAGAAFSSGCKAKARKETPEATKAGSSKLSAACQAFVDALCEKVGKSSQGCQEMGKTAELLSPDTCSAAKRDVKFTVDKLAEQRKSCDSLVTKLCGDLGKATESCKMVETQTKSFPPDRCTMMLEHYGEVLADLKRREEGNQPLSPEKQALMAKNDAPSFGPENAKVTVVEFSDFQCPYCPKAADTVSAIKKKYAGKVRVVFRQFPLSFHDKAHVAAEAAMAAHAQGKFWELHDKMFANQGALDRPSLDKYASEVGLKVPAFKKALDTKQFAAAVDADLKLGTEVGVQGTPSMYINGKRVENPADAEAVGKMIDEILKAS